MIDHTAQTVSLAIAVGGFLISLSGVGFTYATNRRAQYARVLEEAAKLTTGEIAVARNIVGAVMAKPTRRGSHAMLTDAEIEAFFKLLWIFDRLDGLFLSLRPTVALRGWRYYAKGHGKRLSRPQVLLLTAIQGPVRTWIGYTDSAPWSKRLNQPLRFANSDSGLRNLARQLTKL